jgi:hypothetical protein
MGWARQEESVISHCGLGVAAWLGAGRVDAVSTAIRTAMTGRHELVIVRFRLGDSVLAKGPVGDHPSRSSGCPTAVTAPDNATGAGARKG